MKKESGIKKLINSFKFAFSGCKLTFQAEQNMKIHTIIALLVLILGVVFEISHVEWMFLVIVIGLVISAEIINTSIENLVDLVTLEHREKARVAKDTSAAFVLILSGVAVIIGLIIFIPKILEMIGRL